MCRNDEKRKACEAKGYELHETSDPSQPVRFYWLHRDAEPHLHGNVFNSENEMWDDCYSVNVQGKEN